MKPLLIPLLFTLIGCTSTPRSTPELPPAISIVDVTVNRLPYVSDMNLFGVNDYWQTPTEMLTVTQSGDCEDYAFTKAYLLVNSGMPREDVQFVTYRNKYNPSKTHVALLVQGVYVLDTPGNNLVDFDRQGVYTYDVAFKELEKRRRTHP